MEGVNSQTKPYELLDIVTQTTPPKKWWSYKDLFLRAILRPVMLHYYNLVVHFGAHFIYSWNHMKLWYNTPTAVVSVLLYPFIPLVVFAARMFKDTYGMIKGWIYPSEATWETGNVWFVEPDSIIKKIIWSFAKDFSPYAAGFWLVGTSKRGMDQTWYDHETHKDFWRALFEKMGARYPKALGRLENDKVVFYEEVECDVVCKIVDSYLGIGDLFLIHGTDFKNKEDLIQLLTESETYRGKQVIVMEWVRPDPSLGVHQIDVVTIKTKKHGVVPLSILLWGDCTGASSHSSQCGYMIDYETETVVSATEWYTYFFLGKPAKRIGQKIEGIKQGVQQCIRMHEEIKQPWLRAVGWDFMVTNRKAKATDDSLPTKNVFFEGNFAHQRFPRRVFLGWESFFANIKHWSNEISA